MSEEETPQSEAQEDRQEKIEMPTEQYNALLDRLDEQDKLIQELTKKGKSEEEDEDDLDFLAETGKKKKQPELPEPDLDFEKMSKAEFADFIEKRMMERVVGPLTYQDFQLKFRLDLMDLKSDHDDVSDYKKDIYDLMIANPKLDMKKAYILAKTENPKEKKSEKETPEANRRSLRHLPDTRGSTHSERPGPSASMTTSNKPAETIKEAASRAFDEIFK